MKKYNQKISFLSLVTILFFTVVILTGCNNMSNYSGDGQLIDKGKKAATDRYVLKLGTIDFGKKGKKTYLIRNLPKMNFVVGFEIDLPYEKQSVIGAKIINPTVLLQLSKSDGKVVFSKKASLDSWTWSIPLNESKAFIYGRGEPGTFFNPVPKNEYALTFTVVHPFSKKIEYSALLLAKSGGWK